MILIEVLPAFIEIHKLGIAVCSLLAGFTLSSTIMMFHQTWHTPIKRVSAFALFFSSLCFICTVCISALVVFVYEDFTRLEAAGKLASPGLFFWDLFAYSFYSGGAGLIALFLVFALLGWEKDQRTGMVTSAVSAACLFSMLMALNTVRSEYLQPNYLKVFQQMEQHKD